MIYQRPKKYGSIWLCPISWDRGIVLSGNKVQGVHQRT